MPLINDPAIWFKDLFVNAGLSYSLSSFLSTIALVLIVILLSWFSNLIAKAIILKIVPMIVKKTIWALKAYPAWLVGVHKLTYIYIAGLGAMAAVLILVFRDTLFGLVASIQLSADKMLKVGDWISIPRRDLDGVVTDITLKVFQRPTDNELQPKAKK